jgi:hypothetical protein
MKKDYDSNLQALEDWFLEQPFVTEIMVTFGLLVALLVSLYCISHC